MIVIFVESPHKAKAIKEYLKNEKEEYKVLATVGHIRNLSKKSGSIEIANNYNYKWEFTPQWEKNKTTIINTSKEADLILIASDPDREGEAIAWHLEQVLREKKVKAPIERILFYSITKNSIIEAIQNKIKIRQGLVESYLARVGLDYLFGYSISPLLWRKAPCCKSAGRVQSSSLKLVIDKENEILNFIKEQYITIHAEFNETKATATLTEYNNEKFENGNIFEKEEKQININSLKESTYKITKITKQTQKQNAPAPFITSTLQQAASSTLNFSPKMTMQYAQKLYEGFSINGKHTGLITYMRTDSFNIEKEALTQIRNKLKEKYGANFLSEKPINHKKTSKNAQEAHEAIRPIDINLEPDSIIFEDANLKKLYTLIWNRTLASQCTPALIDKTSITITATKDQNIGIFSMSRSITTFKSFKDILKTEEDKEEDQNNIAQLKENTILNLKELTTKDHETQPPKRYSEATFISQLEKLGIGRPSTYSKILSVLLEREYIEKQKKIIIPTQKGWIVTSFLTSYFKNEIAAEFTSSMEEKLDELSNSGNTYLSTIQSFWEHLENLINQAKNIAPIDVFNSIETNYPKYFQKEHNKCQCGDELILKITKFGAIRGCKNYPECTQTLSLIEKAQPSEAIATTEEGDSILIKNGPYGTYIQIDKDPPKKIPVPKIWLKNTTTITEEQAKLLAQLPKIIGTYQDHEIKINIGRFGMYIQHNKTFVSISNLNITQEEAIKKIEDKLKKLSNKN